LTRVANNQQADKYNTRGRL